MMRPHAQGTHFLRLAPSITWYENAHHTERLKGKAKAC